MTFLSILAVFTFIIKLKVCVDNFNIFWLVFSLGYLLNLMIEVQSFFAGLLDISEVKIILLCNNTINVT